MSDARETYVMLVGASDLAKPLRTLGYATQTLRSLSQLLKPPEGNEVRAIVLGPRCDLDEIRSLLPKIRNAWPLVDVLIWRPRISASGVRAALGAGARDVLLATATARVAAEVERIIDAQVLLPHAEKQGNREGPIALRGSISRSPVMQDLFETVRQVAATDATVLILGETGTGKELLARALHAESARAGRFVALNCGAVSETLIDSELFGYVKGAFTGATTDRGGLFRHADNGTLMLDEVGNIPLSAQYRLLRVLQEGAVRPVGGQSEIQVDVRVIAATSNALEADVQRGRFREDLFYRLDVIRLEVPPLRQRPEDIVYLFGHFARRTAEQYNVERPDVSDDFLDALVSYQWPGNVRQLENITERVVLTKAGARVKAGDLKRMLGRGRRRPGSAAVATERSDAPSINTALPMKPALQPRVEALEREYLAECLRAFEGKVIATADHAGISRRTLLRKMKQHGLDKREFKAAPNGLD